ncbi:hypothetical protein, partial [Nocardia abscessus]|uniref:hypothetical protein n=1 Tax=Nocardia abscessus TaxID=120957 RepID=UPI002453F5C1
DLAERCVGRGGPAEVGQLRRHPHTSPSSAAPDGVIRGGVAPAAGPPPGRRARRPAARAAPPPPPPPPRAGIPLRSERIRLRGR